jgi:hypothetical protein
MPFYQIRAKFEVERYFSVEAPSKAEAEANDSDWQEDQGDELTLDRLSVEVEEIIPDLSDAANAAEEIMEEVAYYNQGDQAFMDAYDHVAAAAENPGLDDLRGALEAFEIEAAKHAGQNERIDENLDVIRSALRVEETDEVTADA